MAKPAANDYKRNNLDGASSPYLRQHSDNPVWWQEWSVDVLEYARQADKPLFVSVGYATCHWCHVMASDTFSDRECARLLNEGFVSIKVDREQRPDIDQAMMDFLVASQGSGGWPLNVFLSPQLSPFFAVTYLGAQPKFGRPGFADILPQILEFYNEKRDRLRSSSLSLRRSSPDSAGEADDRWLTTARREMVGAFDQEFGGFGTGQKFPPHSTLLYLLLDISIDATEDARRIASKTLDAMASGGLHDHLQGGFFRYCVDRAWTIPHFEKMLYDQSMLLWTYSAAADLLNDESYAAVARGIVRCLEGTFRSGDVFVSAHDADTGHVEGGTYVFTVDELSGLLSRDDFSRLEREFDLTESGNFEGKNHLVRRAEFGSDEDLQRILDILLAVRKKRAQPTTDTKIVTSWNCLAATAFVEAGRRLKDPALIERAAAIEAWILAHHVVDGRVYHSSNDSAVQRQEFLEDLGALFLLETYLLEYRQFLSDSQGADETRQRCAWLSDRLNDYRSDNSWLEAKSSDFVPVPAQEFDSPTPSSVSLVRLATARWASLTGEVSSPYPVGSPMSQDFASLAALWSAGYVHEVHATRARSYRELPYNAIQIRGSEAQDCYQGVCRRGVPERSS